MPAWVLRCHGVQNNSFIDEKTGKMTNNYGTVVVKSMWWPGAYTLYNNKRTHFIYCGDGHKHESATYYPIKPPMMIKEGVEKKPYDEPNPTKEWLKKKAAWDAANSSKPAEE
jgi:hypothetical protein